MYSLRSSASNTAASFGMRTGLKSAEIALNALAGRLRRSQFQWFEVTDMRKIQKIMIKKIYHRVLSAVRVDLRMSGRNRLVTFARKTLETFSIQDDDDSA